MHRANRQRVSNHIPSDRLRTLPRHLSLCALPPPSPRHTPSQPLPPASLHPTLTHPSLPTLPIPFPSPSPHSSSALVQSPPPLTLPSRHLISRCQPPMFLYITPLGPLHNRQLLAPPGLLSCHFPRVTSLSTANAGPRPIVPFSHRPHWTPALLKIALTDVFALPLSAARALFAVCAQRTFQPTSLSQS